MHVYIKHSNFLTIYQKKKILKAVYIENKDSNHNILNWVSQEADPDTEINIQDVY